MSFDPGDRRMSPEPEPFNPAAEPPKAGHGCFFYGCITAIVLAVLLLIALGLGSYFGYQAYLRLVNQYTSPTPVTLPKVEIPQEERKALIDRIEAFKKALDEGEETEPLILTGDELNVWIAEKSEMEDRVYFVLEGDKLKGQISFPLGETGLPGVKGRYLNGQATFRASLQDGKLDVRAEAIEVNGKPLSQQLLTSLGSTNLAEDAFKEPENARVLNQLESLQIKDGKLVITAKPVKDRGKASSKEEEPESEPTTKPGVEPPPPAEATKDAMPPSDKPDEKPAPPPTEPLEKTGETEKPAPKAATP